MRCKKHFSDLSSTVGVCASCLRQRLQGLIDAQSQPLPLPPPDDRRQPPAPPPLVFPRSVSPYISRRKSDTSAAYDAIDFSDYRRHHHHQRFFSTPQVAHAASKKKSKFHFFSNLFRSRSSKSRHSSDPFSDPNVSGYDHNREFSELDASSSSSSSWISGFASRLKKSTLRLSSLDESSVYDGRRGRRLTGRGMSPDIGGDDSDGYSPSTISYSPESWKKTPSRPRHARVKTSPARSNLTSGIGFCLSPLMRPSPGRHWSGKAAGAEAAGFSGEIRSAAKPHLSTAASLRANRSRKLADFGRLNHNR